jgi:hypothetical protein
MVQCPGTSVAIAAGMHLSASMHSPAPRSFAPTALASFLLAALLSACAATAHFHSRTGADYAPVAIRAIACSEDEARAVTAAGGIPIGTVDAKALAVNATEGDLTDKAAKVAADRGGTHVVLTARGIESFTYAQPGQSETVCQRVEGGRDCQTTYTPPSETTVEKPTAAFVVFRVPPEKWTALPESLRPAPRAQ